MRLWRFVVDGPRDIDRAWRIMERVWIGLGIVWALWLVWLAIFFFVLHGQMAL